MALMMFIRFPFRAREELVEVDRGFEVSPCHKTTERKWSAVF